jgi:hypothetical protein
MLGEEVGRSKRARAHEDAFDGSPLAPSTSFSSPVAFRRLLSAADAEIVAARPVPFAQLATGSPTAPDCLPCTPLRSGFVLKSRNVTQYFQVCRANDFSKADYAAWGAPGWCSPREGDGPWTRWG